MNANHKWGEPMRIDTSNTLRTCAQCGIVRRTRHEPANDPQHWTEYETRGKRIGEIGKAPTCAGGIR